MEYEKIQLGSTRYYLVGHAKSTYNLEGQQDIKHEGHYAINV